MGVAAKIGEHVRGAGEGRFAVDDPGLPSELGQPGVEGGRIGEGREPAGEMQLVASEGLLQSAQVAAAKHLGEGADGEEETGVRGQPAGAVAGQRAPGDEAVDMDVLGEGLPPRMEDGGHADITPEMTGIAAEADEVEAAAWKRSR